MADVFASLIFGGVYSSSIAVGSKKGSGAMPQTSDTICVLQKIREIGRLHRSWQCKKVFSSKPPHSMTRGSDPRPPLYVRDPRSPWSTLTMCPAPPRKTLAHGSASVWHTTIAPLLYWKWPNKERGSGLQGRLTKDI